MLKSGGWWSLPFWLLNEYSCRWNVSICQRMQDPDCRNTNKNTCQVSMCVCVSVCVCVCICSLCVGAEVDYRLQCAWAIGRAQDCNRGVCVCIGEKERRSWHFLAFSLQAFCAPHSKEAKERSPPLETFASCLQYSVSITILLFIQSAVLDNRVT